MLLLLSSCRCADRGEPLAVSAFGVWVPVLAEFEAGKLGLAGVEVVGCGFQGVMGCLSGWAEIVDRWCGGGVGQVAVDLAGDEAFGAAHDLFGAQPHGAAAGHVVATALIAAHADEHDAVDGYAGGTVAAAAESCRVVLPEEAGTGAAPMSAANCASEPMRAGLSPAVMSSWAAVSAPTPCTALSPGACRSVS